MRRMLLWRGPRRHVTAVLSDVGSPSTSLITLTSLPSTSTTDANNDDVGGFKLSRHEERWMLRRIPTDMAEQSAVLGAIFPGGRVPASDNLRLLSINGMPVDELPADTLHDWMHPCRMFSLMLSMKHHGTQHMDEEHTQTEAEHFVVVEEMPLRRRGRPSKARNAPIGSSVEHQVGAPRRGRGRPPLQRNRMVVEDLVAVAAPPTHTEVPPTRKAWLTVTNEGEVEAGSTRRSYRRRRRVNDGTHAVHRAASTEMLAAHVTTPRATSAPSSPASPAQRYAFADDVDRWFERPKRTVAATQDVDGVVGDVLSF